jgi:hypothetical protein
MTVVMQSSDNPAALSQNLSFLAVFSGQNGIFAAMFI